MRAEECKKEWLKVIRIYEETREQNDPSLTINKILEELGNKVEEVFATVAAIKKNDGRIYGRNRKYMDSIPVNPASIRWERSNPMLYADLDHIHTAHINQLITALYAALHTKVVEKQMLLEKADMEYINTLLRLTGDEIYQKYGLKRDEVITRTAIFPDGVEADINLVICDGEDKPYTEGILFDHGAEVTNTECEDFFAGEWVFDYKGTTYTVRVGWKNEMD